VSGKSFISIDHLDARYVLAEVGKITLKSNTDEALKVHLHEIFLFSFFARIKHI
jgi:hypothetical protein